MHPKGFLAALGFIWSRKYPKRSHDDVFLPIFHVFSMFFPPMGPPGGAANSKKIQARFARLNFFLAREADPPGGGPNGAPGGPTGPRLEIRTWTPG